MNSSRGSSEMHSEEHIRDITRRHFFANCKVGLGSLALASMLDGRLLGATPTERTATTDPLATHSTHFAPRAKRVIFLFMAGGPSQLELFDDKPKLRELDGQVIPSSFVANKRFAFIKQDAKLLGT